MKKNTIDIKKYKILIPDMLPNHFRLICYALKRDGYDLELLTSQGRHIVDEGLKNVHNDACYPALLVVGQFMDALQSGKYDLNNTALLISQTGGGCRASNYIYLIRKAVAAKYPQVPVFSLNFQGIDDYSLRFSIGSLMRVAYSCLYGDLIMSLYNQCKPYETVSEASDKAREKALSFVMKACDSSSFLKYKHVCSAITDCFREVPLGGKKKTKVGIVGEIYVKYSPLANNNLEKFLLGENCEPELPGLTDFVLYCIANRFTDRKLYGKKGIDLLAYGFFYKMILSLEKKSDKILEKAGFAPFPDFEELRRLGDKVINQGVKMGEGWLIPAEMAYMAEHGTYNIVCAQPFGCLPNHIVGKGMVRKLRVFYPDINIVAVDYDPGATKVNQENRIKLMLALSGKNRD